METTTRTQDPTIPTLPPSDPPPTTSDYTGVPYGDAPVLADQGGGKLTQHEHHAQRADAMGALSLLLDDAGDEEAASLYRDAQEAHAMAAEAARGPWSKPVARACLCASACERAAREGDRTAVGAFVERTRDNARDAWLDRVGLDA